MLLQARTGKCRCRGIKRCRQIGTAAFAYAVQEAETLRHSIAAEPKQGEAMVYPLASPWRVLDPYSRAAKFWQDQETCGGAEMMPIRPEDLAKMNLVIFDIEGSGCIPGSTPYESGSIVSLGAVDFNTKAEFYEECKVMDGRSYDDYALKINGFTKEQIFDNGKQNVMELVRKFEEFCAAHNSKIIAAWGDYDIKMLNAAYSHYGEPAELPSKYLNLKNVSKAIAGKSRPGLSNTAIKLGISPETYPHIGINGARLASEVTSLMLFGKHFYEEYEAYPVKAAIGESITLNTVEIGAARGHRREKNRGF